MDPEQFVDLVDQITSEHGIIWRKPERKRAPTSLTDIRRISRGGRPFLIWKVTRNDLEVPIFAILGYSRDTYIMNSDVSISGSARVPWSLSVALGVDHPHFHSKDSKNFIAPKDNELMEIVTKIVTVWATVHQN